MRRTWNGKLAIAMLALFLMVTGVPVQTQAETFPLADSGDWAIGSLDYGLGAGHTLPLVSDITNSFDEPDGTIRFTIPVADEEIAAQEKEDKDKPDKDQESDEDQFDDKDDEQEVCLLEDPDGDPDDSDKDKDKDKDKSKDKNKHNGKDLPQCLGGSGAGLLADFNGDGITDLAIGVPFEDVGSSQDQGTVHVLFGSSSGITATGDRQLNPGTAAGDRAGTALAAGDFNGDGKADLAVGVPGGDVSGRNNAGYVRVYYGPSFSSNQVWSQNSSGIGGVSETGDAFGSTLTVGDFDGDGFLDLAVGVPDEDVGSISNAGAVNIIYGSASGLTASGDQIFDQNMGLNISNVEAGDRFSAALAAGDFDGDSFIDLAIGVPDEDLGSISNAGAVSLLWGSESGLEVRSNRFWTQDSSGIAGAAEAGDRFGFSLAVGNFDGDGFKDLAIGVPYEDVGVFFPISDAGAVNIIHGSNVGLTASGNQIWDQNSFGILDSSEAGDRFGFSLAAADYNSDGESDLAIGVPFEDFSGLINPGVVHVFYGTSNGLSESVDQLWTQNVSGIEGVAESDDRWGTTLAWGRFNSGSHADLAIGAPGEDIGSRRNAGSVNIIYGSSTRLTNSGDQIWHQNSSGISDSSETGDQFGGSIY